MMQQDRLHELIQSAEAAQNQMCEAPSDVANQRFEDIKRLLREAIELADAQGESSKVVWLEHRLAHVGGIFRSQSN